LESGKWKVESERLEGGRLEAVVKKLEGLEGYKVEMSRCRESRAEVDWNWMEE
jgi:hypothetical protein